MKDNLAQLKRIIKEEHQKLLQEQGSSLTKLGTGGKALQIWKPPLRNPVNIPISGLGAAGALSGLQYAPLATLTKQPLATNIGTGAKFSELDLPKQAAKDLPPDIDRPEPKTSAEAAMAQSRVPLAWESPPEIKKIDFEGTDYFYVPETPAIKQTPTIQPWRSWARHEPDLQPSEVTKGQEAQVNNLKNRLVQDYYSGQQREAHLARGYSVSDYDNIIFPQKVEKINNARIEFLQPHDDPPPSLTREEWSTSRGIYSPGEDTIYINAQKAGRNTLVHEFGGHKLSHDSESVARHGRQRQETFPRTQAEEEKALEGIIHTLTSAPAYSWVGRLSKADQAELLLHTLRYGELKPPGEAKFPGDWYDKGLPNLGFAQAGDLYSLMGRSPVSDTIGSRQGYTHVGDLNVIAPENAPAGVLSARDVKGIGEYIGSLERQLGKTLDPGERLSLLLEPDNVRSVLKDMHYVTAVEEVRANLMTVRDKLERPLKAQDIIDACKGISSHGADAINSVPAFRDFLKCGTPGKTAETFNKIVKVIHQNQIHLDRRRAGQRPQTRMVTESKLKQIIQEELTSILSEDQRKNHLYVDIILQYEKDFTFYGYVLNQIRALPGVTIAKVSDEGAVDIYPDKKKLFLRLKFIPDRPLTQYLYGIKRELQRIQDLSGTRILSAQLSGIPTQID